MRRKQAAKAHPQKRLNDKKMRRRRGRNERHTFRIRVQFGERASQSIRISGEVRASFIGLVFTRARDGKLNEHSSNRGQEEHEYRPQSSAAIVVVAFVAAEDHSPAREVRKISNRAGDCWGCRSDMDVPLEHGAWVVR